MQRLKITKWVISWINEKKIMLEPNLSPSFSEIWKWLRHFFFFAVNEIHNKKPAIEKNDKNHFQLFMSPSIDGPSTPPPLFFFYSYRLLKTCFNIIFPISSLSFFFLPCFVIVALNYVSVSFGFLKTICFQNQFFLLRKRGPTNGNVCISVSAIFLVLNMII